MRQLEINIKLRKRYQPYKFSYKTNKRLEEILSKLGSTFTRNVNKRLKRRDKKIEEFKQKVQEKNQR